MTSQPNENRKKSELPKRKRHERLRLVILLIVTVIMVLAATVCVLYTRWVKKPVLPPEPHGVSSSPVSESGTPSSEEPLDLDAVEPKVSGERKSKDFYTILVVGTDTSSNSTDTIMVVSYDVTHQKATVMSIPRDTLVNCSAYYYARVNSIYATYGRGERGMDALTREVSELVGFTPDFRVFINWELVGQMVDAIGGVEFYVPWHMEYYDPYQDLNIYLREGLQTLNGDKAMELVRWRKNNPGIPSGSDGSDLARLKMQQDFLKAVLKQTLQLKNVTKIGQLSQLFGENVDSDLTVENLFWFASQAIFGGLSVDDVEFVTMPIYGYKAYVYPNQRELLELINTKLNPFVSDVTIRELDLISVNADGSLRSSTGVLANPAAAFPLPSDDPDSSEDPDNSDDPDSSDDPDNSDDPNASDDPNVSDDPNNSGEPSVSDAPQPSEDPQPTESGAEPSPAGSEGPDSSAQVTEPVPVSSTEPDIPPVDDPGTGGAEE